MGLSHLYIRHAHFGGLYIHHMHFGGSYVHHVHFGHPYILCMSLFIAHALLTHVRSFHM